MLIDLSYFYEPLDIATISDSAQQSRVTRFINIYEPLFLEKLMGRALYLAYTTGIGEVSPEPKWTELRDGKTYTNLSGEEVQYKGLKFSSGDVKQSPIAQYIWYQWQKRNQTFSTASGEKQNNSFNSEAASVRRKMASEWNQMVEWNEQFVDFVLSNSSDYPEFQTHYGTTELMNLTTRINPLF